jgi:hypothetical protein
MRRWAFIISILGLLALIVLMNFSPAKEVDSYEDLEKLEINSKVLVEGKVANERILYENVKLLDLGNGIDIICECSEFFSGEEVSIEGLVSEYNGKKQITVLEISAKADSH